MAKKVGINFSENDIRPKNFEDRQHIAIKEDIEWLLKHKKNFVSVPCPACGSRESKSKFKKNNFNYVDCVECQTFYVNPRPTLEIIEDFLKISKNYEYWSKHIFPASEEIRRKKIFIPRVNKVLDICSKYDAKTNHLLEVGAGFGLFCEELNSRKVFDDVIAIEPTPDLAKICRNKGIEIIEKPIEKINLSDDLLFDVLVNFEVIEHLFSPKDFILQCKKFLKKDGLFIVTCPNGKGFDMEVLGVECGNIDHEHLNYFNPTSLSMLLGLNDSSGRIPPAPYFL